MFGGGCVTSIVDAVLKTIWLYNKKFLLCFSKAITPWEVEAADEIDYTKLVRSFG